MPNDEEQQTPAADAPVKRPTKKRFFKLPDGRVMPQSEFKSVTKFDRDVIVYYHGEEKVVIPAEGKKKEKVEWITPYDPDHPLLSKPITPSVNSPVCQQCGLYEHNARNPFMPYHGPKDPLITIIFDGVTRAEDIKGELGTDGSPAVIRRIIQEAFENIEVGGLMVNDVPTFRIDHMPYGGVKDSGIGREGPRYAIEEMTELKTVVIHGS